ncbi:acyl-CoA dehydrogenase family protein [Mycobacterium sp. AT1]|uniref:acyl-CoA dehydrogenase family protein n=1 Tax=Mycobacterium sp. AT1 TaxID=1961706 RepID=UPI0009AEB6F7|nr:acyl-CoA dehydrogenase family protein [Mycobacterium sp. AT1]OPX05005.1 hypothetical protein B1790_33985 [Mycobacterium sp. AT1]
MASTIEQDDRPTRVELLDRAVALQPLLRSRAADGELHRRTPDDVVQAMTSAGLFRLRTPRRFGGYGADVRTMLDVTSALGEADGSAAWHVGLSATAAWVSSHASEDALRELYGSDPDTRVSGSAASIPARRVEGGVLVSGRWPYASGCLHAQWASIGVLTSAAPDQPDEPFLCLVPASELTVENTWRTVGMLGTGSNTWVGDDLFVPTHRMIPMAGMIDGSLQSSVDDPQRWLTFVPMAMLNLFGPILGMGRAALTLVAEAATTKPLHYTFIERQRDSVSVQLQVADAALKIQTASLHAYAMAEELDASSAENRVLGYADRARLKASCGYATQQVLEAMQALLNVHGAASFAEGSPLQRYWRDANTAARHAGLNAGVALEVFGRSLLGVANDISAMV